jgi:hypothetical protein
MQASLFPHATKPDLERLWLLIQLFGGEPQGCDSAWQLKRLCIEAMSHLILVPSMCSSIFDPYTDVTCIVARAPWSRG